MNVYFYRKFYSPEFVIVDQAAIDKIGLDAALFSLTDNEVLNDCRQSTAF